MRKAMLVVVLTLLVGGMHPALSHAYDAGGVRHRLITAKLSPKPLFPTRLPPPWVVAHAKFSHHGPLFDVWYTDCCAKDMAATLIVGYRRLRFRALREEIRFTHQIRDPVRVTHIGSRRVYELEQDIDNVDMWHEQGFTYELRSHQGVEGRSSFQQLAAVVASLAPLGTEYRGSTAHGDPMVLYSTQLGLDYHVAWNPACDDGVRRILSTFANPFLVAVDQAGHFRDQASHAVAGDPPGQYADQTQTVTLDGTLGPTRASGTFDGTATGRNTIDANRYLCDTGNLSWTAAKTP